MDVVLASLPRDLKRKSWDFIQRERPGTAALLRGEDAEFEAFKQLAGAGAVVSVPLEDTGLTAAELGG